MLACSRLAGAAQVSLTATDSRGTRVTLASAPRRIVSLSPGTTELLFALGLQGRIVADTTYCNYPAAAAALPKIGDVNTSIEKVIAQRPDLIVASASANRRAIGPLERLHMPVFAIDPKTFPELYASLRAVGAITGQGRQAEQTVRTMVARVRAVRAAAAHDPARPRVLIIVQDNPLMVAGANNFMDDLVTMAGGTNIGRSAGEGWISLSPERAVILRPDVVLAGSYDIKQIRSRSLFAALPAVRNHRLYAMPGDEAIRPGPRLADALAKIAAALHPGISLPGK